MITNGIPSKTYILFVCKNKDDNFIELALALAKYDLSWCT